MENYVNGIIGVVVGDALGCPVQFESRETVAEHPVNGMVGHGTFNLPEGSWTDDSSLTLALLDSINNKHGIDYNDIMNNFIKWYCNGEYTPYGYAYDIGRCTAEAIKRYIRNKDVDLCGGRSENDNGNGSLMRILPVCIYCVEKGMSDKEAVNTIHAVSSLTHAHIRSCIACGLYYFIVKEIINGNGVLNEMIVRGLHNGFQFYDGRIHADELKKFFRLRNLPFLLRAPISDIRASGYVVDTLEASVWALLTTSSFKDALLNAVNLGDDTDTVGAVTGGLAGLYYGLCDIQYDWIDSIKLIDWIKDMCIKADAI